MLPTIEIIILGPLGIRLEDVSDLCGDELEYIKTQMQVNPFWNISCVLSV